jgi:hypothetical protein
VAASEPRAPGGVFDADDYDDDAAADADDADDDDDGHCHDDELTAQRARLAAVCRSVVSTLGLTPP